MRRAANVPELLDGPVTPVERDASLRDLDRLNAWFGGYALTLSRVRRAARGVPRGRRFVVVDVGGGRGDFAVRVARWARRVRRSVQVIVVERDVATAAAARAACARHREVAVVVADGTALPLRERAADVVTTSLTLHHLEPDDAVGMLAAMAAAARRAVVVNDLLRGRVSLTLVWLATRLLRLHPMSRHDGPLSVRRAYTPDELCALAARAGLRDLRVVRYPALARVIAETAA